MPPMLDTLDSAESNTTLRTTTILTRRYAQMQNDLAGLT